MAAMSRVLLSARGCISFLNRIQTAFHNIASDDGSFANKG